MIVFLLEQRYCRVELFQDRVAPVRLVAAPEPLGHELGQPRLRSERRLAEPSRRLDCVGQEELGPGELARLRQRLREIRHELDPRDVVFRQQRVRAP